MWPEGACHPGPTVEPLENKWIFFPTLNGFISQSDGEGR